MATSFEIVLPFGTPQAHEAAEAALGLIDRLEDQLTVYRDTSEVSRLNRQAATAPVEVEERLFGLIALAERLSEETQGAFDISLGALIKAWGFYRRRGAVPSVEERAAVMDRIGMHRVALDAARRTVAFRCPGVEINLGSIGKGFALDRAAALLRDEWGVRSGLLHGGHSSVYALGSQPGREDGWPVGILDPAAGRAPRTARRLAILRLRDRALGTSAATFQHLEYNGRRLGHILDPRTGWPAEGMALASVTAPTAAEADALATAFFVMGEDKARACCERRPDIGAVLLPHSCSRPVLLGRVLEEIA
jgi:thiamine biosynthesis lipoprotein